LLPAYPSDVSIVAIVLLVAALALLAVAEWPRLSRRTGVSLPAPKRRRPARRSHLRVVDDDESDEFARSVERDLANLPTIDDPDRRRS
jgi:hypothetical protein